MAVARAKKPVSRKIAGDAGGSGSRNAVRGFMLRFAVLSLVFALVPLIPGWDGLESRYLSVQAVLVNGLLHLLGQPTQLEGTTVFSPAFRMTIAPNCSALGIILFFSATVLAYPARAKRKIVGIMAGFMAIYALNIVRIVTIYFTGARWPERLHGVHEELWPSLLIMGTLFISGVWVYYASNQRTR